MSIGKRIVTKETILSLKDIGDVVRLLDSDIDTYIMDSWCVNFKNELGEDYIEYQRIRAGVSEDTQFSSNLADTINHENFDKLKNLSNIYFNLVNNPSWVDVLLAGRILNIAVPSKIVGYFQKLVKFYIEEVDKKLGK